MNNFTNEMFPAFKNLIIFLHQKHRIGDSMDFIDIVNTGNTLKN